MDAKEMLSEFEQLCKQEGTASAGFPDRFSKYEEARLTELRNEILDVMADSRQACTYMRCPAEG